MEAGRRTSTSGKRGPVRDPVERGRCNWSPLPRRSPPASGTPPTAPIARSGSDPGRTGWGRGRTIATGPDRGPTRPAPRRPGRRFDRAPVNATRAKLGGVGGNPPRGRAGTVRAVGDRQLQRGTAPCNDLRRCTLPSTTRLDPVSRGDAYLMLPVSAVRESASLRIWGPARGC
jgi:hypothetical protein